MGRTVEAADMNTECPSCHGNPDKDTLQIMDSLAMKHHLITSRQIPGGRELKFRDKGRLELFGECRACEEKHVRECLGEPPA